VATYDDPDYVVEPPVIVVNVEVPQGDSWHFETRLATKKPGAPLSAATWIDFAGWTATGQIRREGRRTSQVVADLTVELVALADAPAPPPSEVDEDDPPLPTVIVDLATGDTDGAPLTQDRTDRQFYGRFYWDIQFHPPSGQDRTYIKGRFTLTGDVTVVAG
jgi:hypothetical protein